MPATAQIKSDPYWCMPARKEVCNEAKPCEQMEPGKFFVILDESKNEYVRCDGPDPKTCSTYTMVTSGDAMKYRTFEMPGRGGFSKLGPNGDWIEAVSLASMVIVSHGFCYRSSEIDKSRKTSE